MDLQDPAMEAHRRALKTQLSRFTRQIDFVMRIIRCSRDLFDFWLALELALTRLHLPMK